MRIDVVTTFPELFTPHPPGVLGVSIPGRAIASGALAVGATDIRGYAPGPHQKTDDRPFGGGPGMVMSCQPVWDAVRAAEALDDRPARRVFPTPDGVPLTQGLVRELASEPRLVVLCGHYEGVDRRVLDRLDPLEVSLGDYVLSGGELAALVLIDAVARLLPGVLGHEGSALQDSFEGVRTVDEVGVAMPEKAVRAIAGCSGDELRRKALLDCPHYTRPRVWEGAEVPDVLLSGDHQAIARWRLERQLERTRARRPDLLDDLLDGGGDGPE
ncbi:MAG: tRNA (guanine(37)-N(1))-methyltransferase [Planctomycetota bacterium]